MTVMVSDELLIDMMREGWYAQFTENTDGIPKDAVMVHSYTDTAWGCVAFVFFHESFDEVALGHVIPIRSVSFKKYFYPDVQALLASNLANDKVAVLDHA